MTPVPHIVFATHFSPLPTGHGGHHRAYQIAHDLAQFAEPGALTIISYEEWKAARLQSPTKHTAPADTTNRAGSISLLSKLAFMIKHRLPYLRVTHPVDLLIDTSPMLQWYATPEFTRHFTDTLQRLPRPLLVVVEHPSLARILLASTPRTGLMTVACPQNIESFDTCLPVSHEQPRQKHLAALSFADEWNIWEQCDHMLCISKVEAGLFSGLGLNCEHYPYRPTGRIRDYFQSVRACRTTRPPPGNIMLMLGSCEHKTTHQAFANFLQHQACEALPAGYQLVVMGSGTTALPVPQVLASRVTLAGRVSDEEMKSWLVQASGVFLPQQMGFGALTRLSELACAGIPTAVSRHVAYSMDLPPRIRVVNEPTRDWPDIAREFAMGAHSSSPEEYTAWDQCQSIPWQALVLGRNVSPTSDPSPSLPHLTN